MGNNKSVSTPKTHAFSTVMATYRFTARATVVGEIEQVHDPACV
jgi:hypothetical protein